MTLLIKGALILSMADDDEAPFVGDILIENDRIAAIGAAIAAPDAELLDGANRLVMPRAGQRPYPHFADLFRGRYHLPLELLMLYAYPMLGAYPLPPSLVYLRTLLVAIGRSRTGVTGLLDDVIELPSQDLDQLDAPSAPMQTLGIRATCSGHVINRSSPTRFLR